MSKIATVRNSSPIYALRQLAVAASELRLPSIAAINVTQSWPPLLLTPSKSIVRESNFKSHFRLIRQESRKVSWRELSCVAVAKCRRCPKRKVKGRPPRWDSFRTNIQDPHLSWPSRSSCEAKRCIHPAVYEADKQLRFDTAHMLFLTSPML